MSPHLNILKIGLLLLLVSWGLKQCTISVATYGLGNSLSETSERFDMRAEIANETLDQRIKIEAEQRKEEPDAEALDALNKEVREKEKEIRESYAEAHIEAAASSASGLSTGMSMMAWFLRLKVLFDLLKIAGVGMILWAAFKLSQDESSPPSVRHFSVAAASVVLFSILAGALLTYFS